jgi:DNA-directed RNA polymerase specialized sigma24 family protein
VDSSDWLDLVRRAQHGEEKAIHRLLELYFGRVEGFARLRLGSRGQARIQSRDTVVRAFIAGVRDLARLEFRDESQFIIHLSKLVAERIEDAREDGTLAKWNADHYVPCEFKIKSPPYGVDLVATGTSPNSEPGDSEAHHHVEECLSRLPSEFRELILLRNYAGASWETLAEEFGLPSPAAARILHSKALVLLGRLARGESD